MVDISDLSSSGTSIATPRALCYISRIMNLVSRNGNKLTAVEALGLAKKAIARNTVGMFVLEEGYNDWFLPSKQEFYTIVTTSWSNNIDIGMVQKEYWTSTEVCKISAQEHFFCPYGWTLADYKFEKYRLRCMRSVSYSGCN